MSSWLFLSQNYNEGDYKLNIFIKKYEFNCQQVVKFWVITVTLIQMSQQQFMEDKENCPQQCLIMLTSAQTAGGGESTRELKTRRKLIRRCKLGQKYYKLKAVNKNKKKSRFVRRTTTKLPNFDGKQFENHVPTQQENKVGQNRIQQVQKQVDKNLGKINFDPSILPEEMQESFKKAQKLKNTDLIIPGVKFVQILTHKSISKWEKALIIYQQYYSRKKRCHFGLILKHKNRLITFDGIKKLWPIRGVQKSFHWEEQNDTWSCGYRVLFWIKKIQDIGIDDWLQHFEKKQPATKDHLENDY